jgi:predicted RNA-binding protein with PIN domain
LSNRYRIIIDGYNLIFQCGLEGRSRSPKSLERARDRLISALSHLSAKERARTTVVYDAKKLPIGESEAKSNRNGVTVHFAIEFEDADSMIEMLISKNSNPKNLLVVSSDHRINKAALRRKSTPIDSDVWFDQLECGKESQPSFKIPVASEQQPRISSEELKELKSVDWAAEFGVDEQNPTDKNPPAFNPFPPGYADDIEEV